MKERELYGTLYDEQGEMMVHEQLMDSYREGTFGRKTETEFQQGKQREQ